MKTLQSLYLKRLSLILLSIFVLGLSSCDDDDNPGTQPQIDENLAEVAEDAGFSALLAAAEEAGLSDALTDENSDLTVFAPTNDAFAAFLSANGWADVTEIPDAALEAVLKYHILGSSKSSSELGASEETLEGNSIYLNTSALTVNGNVDILSANVNASNGIIHVIDAVLMPPTENIVAIAAGNDDFSILVSLLQRAGLVEAVQNGEFTVFAPTNTAFENSGITTAVAEQLSDEELTDILTYHVIGGFAFSSNLSNGDITMLNGESLTVDADNGTLQGANNEDPVGLTATDILGTNGVIHVIDGVLLPPKTIVDVAVYNGFDSLAVAVQEAGLVQALSEGELTVFAPTNAAFVNLLSNLSYAQVSDIPSDLLTAVLTYHVVDGVVSSEMLSDGFVPTLNGQAVKVNVAGLTLNGNTNIVAVDVMADNGIVHAIDKVLVPETRTIAEIAGDAGLSRLVEALTEAGLAETFTLEGNYTVFAPSNAAFDALYSALGASGPADIDDATLTAVLTYHVLGNRVYSSDLTDGAMPETLQGGTFTVNIDSNVTITDNDPDNTDATVTATDIQATNGVIHTINQIILPVDI
ncbi:fasciclin domain-containing protein [Marinigracilibium pacificum]|uniref:Fasciclin domain-containing protein n=1 Tax=Marinigracilibium pacificum TaxID=2729599 RepID=A0A848IYR6_9BACT|nr:fasciclin domain-containing protein [Marinigracilibium pacificum]NMM48415.1 fasciclin domain-containing protein [Marinigracilibium pacificum]